MKTQILSLVLIALLFGLGFNTKKDKAIVWETDYQEAVKKAQKENKQLLLNFTGSDWCGWCKKLDREVFSQESFVDYAGENLVCVKLDFPRYKELPAAQQEQNVNLLKKYGVRGFPTIYLLDNQEKALLKTGYRPGGAEDYISHLEAAVK